MAGQRTPAQWRSRDGRNPHPYLAPRARVVLAGMSGRLAAGSGQQVMQPPGAAGGPRSPWCWRCSAPPAAGCRPQGHRVISLEEATREARTQVADARRALRLGQARLDALEEASEPNILQVHVRYAQEAEYYCYLAGGRMTIRLAPLDGGVTDEDRTAVARALVRGYIECEWEGEGETPLEEAVAAQGVFGRDTAIAPVLVKLPVCVDGQKLHAGSVLYFPQGWETNLGDEPFDYAVLDKTLYTGSELLRRGVRLFGRVTEGLKGLRVQPVYELTDGRYGMDDFFKCPVKTQLSDATFV